MKLLIINTIFALQFIACNEESSTSLEDQDPILDQEYTEEFFGSYDDPKDRGGDVCDFNQPINLSSDGVAVDITVPVMCDIRPFIDLGRPSDIINPADKNDYNQISVEEFDYSKDA